MLDCIILDEKEELNMRKKLILIMLLMLSITGCANNKQEPVTKINTNPANASFINEEIKEMLSDIERVDEEGYLYELNYDFDYYDPLILSVAASVNNVDAGCSAFTTNNIDQDFLLARNYDYNHLDANNEPSGLNLLIKTVPKGKLKSIAMCDAFWLNQSSFFKGAFDDGQTDISNVVLAPYLCVDGMNEAGVSIALLAVDTKDGEIPTNQNTGKEKIIHSILLRYILDNATSIQEAIEIAKQYDIVSSAKQDIHVIISDKDKNTAVLEWRQYENDSEQKLYVTYTNAITNFFVGFDDGEEMFYKDGSLRERYTQVTNLANNYHYGYGHGYHRFNGIVSAMDRYINEDVLPNENGVLNTTMMESQAFCILSEAAQEPGIEKTSLTQFSALYNMNKKTLDLCMERDYTKIYSFSID